MEPIYCTAQQAYKVFYHRHQYFSFMRGVRDMADVHDRAWQKAQEVEANPFHPLRGAVNSMLETLDANILF